MIPVSEELVQTLAAQARPRVENAMAIPAFTPGMAEVNVFDVTGHRDLADRTSDAVRGLGAEAADAAKRRLAQRYRGRNPQRGWIGFALFVATLAAALAAVFASGLRSGDAGQHSGVATTLAIVAAVGEILVLLGSGFQPLHRFVWRMQTLLCVALVIAAALSWSNGLATAAVVQSVAAAVALLVALVIGLVRARGGERTRALDRCVEDAYLDAIADVDAGARRAQASLDAALDPSAAALIVRVRTRLFADLAHRSPALAGFDPLAPAGAAIIASATDPDRWLPAALAKTRHR